MKNNSENRSKGKINRDLQRDKQRDFVRLPTQATGDGNGIAHSYSFHTDEKKRLTRSRPVYIACEALPSASPFFLPELESLGRMAYIQTSQTRFTRVECEKRDDSSSLAHSVLTALALFFSPSEREVRFHLIISCSAKVTRGRRVGIPHAEHSADHPNPSDVLNPSISTVDLSSVCLSLIYLHLSPGKMLIFSPQEGTHGGRRRTGLE